MPTYWKDGYPSVTADVGKMTVGTPIFKVQFSADKPGLVQEAIGCLGNKHGSPVIVFPDGTAVSFTYEELVEMAFIKKQTCEQKEKAAPSAANTESGMQNESITQFITIIVQGKEPPQVQVQQLTRDFLRTTNEIRKRMKE